MQLVSEELGCAIELFEGSPIQDRVVRALLLLWQGELRLFATRDLARAPAARCCRALFPGVEVTLDEDQVIAL